VDDFVDLLVGFFAFRTTQRGLHAAPQQLSNAESFWAHEAEYPGFLPADVIVTGGLDVFNGETCTREDLLAKSEQHRPASEFFAGECCHCQRRSVGVIFAKGDSHRLVCKPVDK
jgi:hypothetical protein